MSRKSRIIVLLASLALLIFAGIFIEFILNLRAERLAKSLLEDVRELKVGESTDGDVQRIIAKYGRETGRVVTNVCVSGTNAKSIAVSSDGLNWLGWRLPWVRLFGNRVWNAEASFAVEGDRLCFIEYDVHVYLIGKLQEISFSGTSEAEPRLSESPAYTSSVWPLRNSLLFKAIVTNHGNDEQHRRAFDFDLSCLARLGGCKAGCEVMPSVWMDDQRVADNNLRALPDEEVKDPRCGATGLR